MYFYKSLIYFFLFWNEKISARFAGFKSFNFFFQTRSTAATLYFIGQTAEFRHRYVAPRNPFIVTLNPYLAAAYFAGPLFEILGRICYERVGSFRFFLIHIQNWKYMGAAATDSLRVLRNVTQK